MDKISLFLCLRAIDVLTTYADVKRYTPSAEINPLNKYIFAHVGIIEFALINLNLSLLIAGIIFLLVKYIPKSRFSLYLLYTFHIIIIINNIHWLIR